MIPCFFGAILFPISIGTFAGSLENLKQQVCFAWAGVAPFLRRGPCRKAGRHCFETHPS